MRIETVNEVKVDLIARFICRCYVGQYFITRRDKHSAPGQEQRANGKQTGPARETELCGSSLLVPAPPPPSWRDVIKSEMSLIHRFMHHDKLHGGQLAVNSTRNMAAAWQGVVEGVQIERSLFFAPCSRSGCSTADGIVGRRTVVVVMLQGQQTGVRLDQNRAQWPRLSIQVSV